MEIYEAINKRRTVRVFKKGVSEEILRKIILAGTKAPSAGNRQPWEFIMVDDPKIIDQIAEHKYQQNRKIPPRFYGSGTTRADVDARAMRQRRAYQNCSVVAVCNSKGREETVSTWMCVENMALAATAEGLRMVPSTFWGKHQKEVGMLLGLSEDYEVTTVALIGAPGEESSPSRRPEFSWLHRNKFVNAP